MGKYNPKNFQQKGMPVKEHELNQKFRSKKAKLDIGISRKLLAKRMKELQIKFG